MKLLYRRQKSLFMHCSSTVHVFKNIKNGSHDTIHTFKNYFAIVFSVFSKMSGIQTDPKSSNTIFKHPIRSKFDQSEII